MQNQPPEGFFFFFFFEDNGMGKFAKFIREHLCWNLFVNKVKLRRSATSLRMRL